MRAGAVALERAEGWGVGGCCGASRGGDGPSASAQIGDGSRRRTTRQTARRFARRFPLVLAECAFVFGISESSY